MKTYITGTPKIGNGIFKFIRFFQANPLNYLRIGNGDLILQTTMERDF